MVAQLSLSPVSYWRKAVNPAEPETSSSLMARVRLRDAQAWRRFVKLYGPLAYGWSRKLGIQPSDAADIVQDVFRAVLSGLENFRRDRPGDSFRGWLWTITQNKVRDHFRRSAKRPEPMGGTDAQHRFQQIADVSLDEASRSDAATENGLVHRALNLIRGEFSSQIWDAFRRATLDGQRAADVADELGMTKGAVRQAKYRILRRLRQELDACE